MNRLSLRLWLDRALHLWRSSLQLRTLLATVALSGIAVAVIGGFISTSVRSNLFDSRRDQVVAESERATENAQSEFSNAAELSDSQDFDQAQSSAREAIARSTTSPGGTLVAMLRVTGQDGPVVMQNLVSRGFDESTMVSDALRKSVDADAAGRVYSQPVEIPGDDNRRDPGLITGSVLDVPGGGRYELFIVYNLRDVQNTLDFVQQTIAVGGIALVFLIAAVSYAVVRLVVRPVRVAAATSQRLAAGELDQRIPVRGEDVLATLARSFNGMADSMQRQIRQLADLSRVQQRFVSDVSHELRTPLTTIRLAGDVLYDQRDDFPAATARAAELLHTQTERFELLLGDLLEMSRYDAGAVQLETEPTNLVRLVEDAIEAVRPLAAERGSELRLVAPGGYFEADVDARRIRRILQNLLGNAIDHGEGLPIVVHVDSDADAVALAVRDYGIGMTPEQVERVFDRFWRADPSRQRRTGGTGLGLAIAQEDAVLHAGRVEVWSQDGAGSCFRLTLPRRRGEVPGESPLDLPPEDGLDIEALTSDGEGGS
ncbi:MtrAB system histidine kinase MtrB [Schumannella sp. 10F1B-5-1]|uniref:MtrAB system histidine kinase MtrB n=1 Tax=Schumannella sp. 10F1B-5-1 TaxID=2590780 RepID=UPI0011328E14|nr:MtrAB system histidine kinase MtrB [Schumannella sp. 10F1B-5-1]TPW73587.1 HAMP domain-containing histidine kinase [Schumannella sp. 10F1B-5-1]